MAQRGIVASCQSPGDSECQRVGRGDDERGLAQDRMPLRKQARRLLRVRDSGPERTLFRGREQMLLRTQAQEPLQKQDR